MTNTERVKKQTNRVQQVEAAMAKAISQASQRGFYGTTSVVLSVQDGSIQHIRFSVEQMIR